MEGTLKKWVNFVKRWQERYFILNDDVLIYCDYQGGPVKGQVHLKVAGIILVPEDPLRIIINTGTSELILRANNITDKINWVNGLKQAQDKILDTKVQVQFEDKIEDLLSDVWMTSAAFDETLSLLSGKLEQQPNLKMMAERLETLGKNLKNKITLISQMIQEEKSKLQENGTIFESFALRSERALSIDEFYPVDMVITRLMNTQPIKYKNLMNNPVFQKLKFTKQDRRDRLPFRKDPNEKLNIWQLCKELIGKDLTRFSVPIILNEPLSMLQRLAEQLEYHETLKIADSLDDSALRMCYVMGFGVANYASNIDRIKKPFNPILGETYELITTDFKFISEQVSHHPPISAGYAESPHFQFWANTDIHTKFYGKMFVVDPQGLLHIVLKKSQDHYTFNKCITKVQNILWGTQYIDQVGEMKFQNRTNGDQGVLQLIERTSKTQYEIKGWVKDKNNVEKYQIHGYWNDKLIVKDARGTETTVWRRHQLPPESNWNYFFTDYAMQLNYLSVDLIQSIPSTDCRLRPDQIALEHGWVELASQEKHRLEEKQRARRRQLQQTGQVHLPRYFEEQFDQNTKERWYKYKGNYFDRQDEGLDLF